MKDSVSFFKASYSVLFNVVVTLLRNRVKNGFDHVYQRLKSLTGSIIVLVLYNIIGAVIFVQLEAPYEREEVTVAKITFDSQHADLIRFLNRVTTTLNNTEYEALK
jgi:hypothetical protein